MKSTSRHFTQTGFTFVALLVILAVLALLAAMLLPALAAAKNKSKRIQCVNNLKECGLAFRIWEGDHNDEYPMEMPMAKGGTKEFVTGVDTFRHFQVMSNELSTPKILICPADTCTVADNFAILKNQNVSYFVSLDASETLSQMFLDGDRNLTNDDQPENGILKLVPGQRLSWTSSIHVNQGNVGLADGSVQQLSDSGLDRALQNSGAQTNIWRISLPE
jgi:prepilin-type processing-associated H-X9-DG protein